MEGNEEVCRGLLQAGASAAVQDSYGMTPLAHAVGLWPRPSPIIHQHMPQKTPCLRNWSFVTLACKSYGFGELLLDKLRAAGQRGLQSDALAQSHDSVLSAQTHVFGFLYEIGTF